ncbi:MAG: S41 family peptidase [Patescibacteria group bacterium]
MLEFFKTRYVTGVILFTTLFFILGIYVGFNNRPEIEKVVNLYGKETAVATEADFSPFWKVWNLINEKYPSISEVTDQERVYGAISGLMSSLNDPYSVFFDPEESEFFEDEIAGNFSGVGMEVGKKDGVLTVIAPLKDTPAYRAGIKSGDKILKIDQIITTDFSVEEAVRLIRGEKGTEVTLTILHDGEIEPTEIKIIRDIINLPTLDTELRSDGIFVIKLYSFSATSSSLFRNAIKEFALAKTDRLVLDLRGNPGGYLSAAVNIASWFLPEGKIVVTEDYGNNKDPEVFRSKGYGIFSDKFKFVILIDGGSASASEIVAGALQDHKQAILVGDKSFGKGSVQEIEDVTDDTILKITVAKWLTPNDHLIAEIGLTPDYLVKFTKKDADAEKDPQMDKAVELLNNWPGIK